MTAISLHFKRPISITLSSCRYERLPCSSQTFQVVYVGGSGPGALPTLAVRLPEGPTGGRTTDDCGYRAVRCGGSKLNVAFRYEDPNRPGLGIPAFRLCFGKRRAWFLAAKTLIHMSLVVLRGVSLIWIYYLLLFAGPSD